MKNKEENNLKEKATKILNDVKDESKKFTKKESEDGKGMAILSYISFLVLIPYLTEKKNKFVIYHAKQGMNLMIFELIVAAATPILCTILLLLSPIVVLLSSILELCFLVLSIKGIVNVCNNEAKELPVINKIKLIK